MVAVTHLDWIMEKLVRIVQAGISDDGTITAKYVKDSLRALSEISKLKGYYTPEKNFNLSMEVNDVQKDKLHELIFTSVALKIRRLASISEEPLKEPQVIY